MEIKLDLTELSSLIEIAVNKAFAKYSFSVATEPSQEELICATDASRILNVSISTIHSYKKQGIIPFHRMGRRIYFRESEILSSLKK